MTVLSICPTSYSRADEISIGREVRIHGNRGDMLDGMYGEIVSMPRGGQIGGNIMVGVSVRAWNSGHNLDGMLEDSSGWYIYSNQLELIETSLPDIDVEINIGDLF